MLNPKILNILTNDAVEVVAVSKGHSLSHIQKCLMEKSFPKNLGENYFEELKSKVRSDVIANVHWHFLGQLQSRKIVGLAMLASTLHGLCRPKELEIIMQHQLKTFFYVQINIANEDNKSGATEARLEELLSIIARYKLQNQFLGLMGVASSLRKASPSEVAQQFKQLRKLRDQYCPSKKLNMGMSSDYEIALDQGSQVLRLGTILFGAR